MVRRETYLFRRWGLAIVLAVTSVVASVVGYGIGYKDSRPQQVVIQILPVPQK